MGKQGLGARLEFVVLAGALAIFAMLVGWWSVFARRLITQHENVSRDLLALTMKDDPQGLTDALAALDARSERLLWMIGGESGTFLVALALCVVVLVVISRRRQQAKEQMERMLQFTSHELKTPIAGVRALLQSLQLGAIPEARRGELMKHGLAECDRLDHLAETVLAYQRAVSRPDARARVAESAKALVEEVLEHRVRTFGQENLTVVSLEDAQVRVDRDAVRVVLENLLDNARKYGGGKVELHGTRASAHFTIEVRDYGQGFDRQDAEAIFRPFERAEKKGVTHGSGLGLSLARELARGMGGELSAFSEGKGQGARFRFALPYAEGARG
ncbi:MAG: HAMP domain-containing histidine kinase [Myxococcaceae bacterium]|nr:HAMP domain-containing histidine kinase [Myxococcaceae bacterium]